jgi:hypothetical protein
MNPSSGTQRIKPFVPILSTHLINTAGTEFAILFLAAHQIIPHRSGETQPASSVAIMAVKLGKSPLKQVKH